jgi:hypothetical protein
MSLSESSQKIIDDVCVFKITENTYYGNIVHRGATMGGDILDIAYGFIGDVQRWRHVEDKKTRNALFNEFLCKVYLAVVEINKAAVANAEGFPIYIQVSHPLGFFGNTCHIVLLSDYGVNIVLDTVLTIFKTKTKVKNIEEAIAAATADAMD